jgi:predicted DNA-binding transcriptional regulator AlpA
MESFLNEIQVSEKIQVSLACLRRWRLRGEGPQYVKVGPLVRYRPEAIEQWVDALPTGVCHTALVPASSGESDRGRGKTLRTRRRSLGRDNGRMPRHTASKKSGQRNCLRVALGRQPIHLH